MFGKLKNKLKEWTNKVADVEEDEVQEEILETPKEEIEEKSDITTQEEKKGFLKKIFSKKEKVSEEEPDEKPKEKLPTNKEIKEETTPLTADSKPLTEKKPDTEKLKEIKEEKPKEKPISDTSKQIEETVIQEEVKEEKKEKPKKKKSFFSSKKTITEDQFNDYAEDLEMILLENNVALEVVDKILEEIKQQIINQELSKKEILNKITTSLTEKIKEVLQEPFDIEKEIEQKEGPYVILFCGINGTGKTTTISKVANMFKQKGKSVVMAAGDTFRAAAIEQLKAHGKKLDIKVITQDYGNDPAAVGFDAIKYAEKNKIDIVLIDTAGRIHTATNLIREMEKIKKVCKPDRTLFVGEAITGNDAVDQVRAFNDNIGIDGIVLSKSDIDEKGGTALSVGYITKKPIIFLGTGQNYEDIEPFDKKKFLEKLDLE